MAIAVIMVGTNGRMDKKAVEEPVVVTVGSLNYAQIEPSG